MALEKEYKYFKDHQEELVAKYFSKYVVISGEEVTGPFETDVEAFAEARKKYDLGTFLIQNCLPGSKAFRQSFRSRVKPRHSLA